MTWTAAETAVTGAVITAAFANTNIRDNTTWLYNAVDSALVVEGVLPVTGSEPTQIDGGFGPAAEFANAVTQSVSFTRYWQWGEYGIAMDILIAASAAQANDFRVQVGWQVNGGATTNVPVTVTPGNTTALYTAALGTILAASDVADGDMLTLTVSRLGGDGADTHTGTMRLYSIRLKRV